MIMRVALLGAIMAGLVGFGVVAFLSMHSRSQAAAAEHPAQSPVLVLAREVRAGSLLRTEDLGTKLLPAVDLPSGAITDAPAARHDLIGGMIRRPLAVGDMLHAEDVMRPGDHGFLAAVLKPGRRAITVGVDAITGTAGLIWPGDRVDVILTQTMDDHQVAPAERIAAETVLQNALVIAIDQLLVQGAATEGPSPQNPRTVTLEVSPREAERVQVAERIGRLSLAVRALDTPSDSGTPEAEANTLPVFAGEVSHALRGDSAPVEPAPVVLRVYQGTEEGKEFKY